MSMRLKKFSSMPASEIADKAKPVVYPKLTGAQNNTPRGRVIYDQSPEVVTHIFKQEAEDKR